MTSASWEGSICPPPCSTCQLEKWADGQTPTSQTPRLLTEARCEIENTENLDSKRIWTAHSANDFSKIHQDDVHTCGTICHGAQKGAVPDQFLEQDLTIDSRLTLSASYFSVSQIKELQSAVMRMSGCLTSGTIGYSSVETQS